MLDNGCRWRDLNRPVCLKFPDTLGLFSPTEASTVATWERPTWVRDLPVGGRPVLVCWVKRIWACPQPLFAQRTWTEPHPVIAPRAVLTERARRWAFEQVGSADAAISRTAAGLGVAWLTVMRQVLGRGAPLVENPDRLAQVSAVGVDETAYLRANSRSTSSRPESPS